MDEQNGLWMKYLGRRPWCTTVVSNFLSKRFNSSTGITNVPAKEGFEEAYFAFSIRNICIHWSCTTHARRGVSIDQEGRLVSKLKKRSLSQKEKEGPSQKEKEGRPGETRPGNGILNLKKKKKEPRNKETRKGPCYFFFSKDEPRATHTRTVIQYLRFVQRRRREPVRG